MAKSTKPLTADQTLHLEQITLAFKLLTEPKYTKGAQEHGNNIWDMTPIQLIDCAIEEAIDQFTYLYTLRQKLDT